jgi:RNA polymerase sigma-70 factor (ECF subfamily)
VGDRRAAAVSVPAFPLPRRARPYAARIVFVERLEPSSQRVEDADTDRLIRRIQAGSRDEFAVLYMRYFDRVYGYLRALLRRGDAADDATQQVFLKVIEGLPRYDPRLGTFRSWLFTIARNHAMDELKLAGRIEPLSAEEIERREPLEAVDLRPLDWITDREVHLFIERLPLSQRQVLFLRYVVGLNLGEIATVLGQSHDAVRQHHARAMRFLRARLTALGREPKGGDSVGAKLLGSRMQILRARRFALIAPGPAR